MVAHWQWFPADNSCSGNEIKNKKQRLKLILARCISVVLNKKFQVYKLIYLGLGDKLEILHSCQSWIGIIAKKIDQQCHTRVWSGKSRQCSLQEICACCHLHQGCLCFLDVFDNAECFISIWNWRFSEFPTNSPCTLSWNLFHFLHVRKCTSQVRKLGWTRLKVGFEVWQMNFVIFDSVSSKMLREHDH